MSSTRDAQQVKDTASILLTVAKAVPETIEPPRRTNRAGPFEADLHVNTSSPEASLHRLPDHSGALPLSGSREADSSPPARDIAFSAETEPGGAGTLSAESEITELHEKLAHAENVTRRNQELAHELLATKAQVEDLLEQLKESKAEVGALREKLVRAEVEFQNDQVLVRDLMVAKAQLKEKEVEVVDFGKRIIQENEILAERLQVRLNIARAASKQPMESVNKIVAEKCAETAKSCSHEFQIEMKRIKDEHDRKLRQHAEASSTANRQCEEWRFVANLRDTFTSAEGHLHGIVVKIAKTVNDDSLTQLPLREKIEVVAALRGLEMGGFKRSLNAWRENRNVFFHENYGVERLKLNKSCLTAAEELVHELESLQKCGNVAFSRAYDAFCEIRAVERSER